MEERRLVTLEDIESGTFLVKVPVTIPDSTQTGLDATSTGVKYTSKFKFKIPKKMLQDVVLRASWTATAGDSVTKIALIDETTTNEVCSVEANAGTDTESTNYTAANLTDDGLVYVRAEITTASATTGATFDIDYVVVELKFGS